MAVTEAHPATEAAARRWVRSACGLEQVLRAFSFASSLGSLPRMDPAKLRALLEHVSERSLGVDEALAELRDLPYADLGFARLDHHRELRTGLPEVVYGEGKTGAQIAELLCAIAERGQPALATRVTAAAMQHLALALPEATLDPISRTARWLVTRREARGHGTICVLSAGTSDMPVAEEAAITAEVFGNRVERRYDLGIAGLHRVLAERASIDAAAVCIVVAGMEGALPSVVAGLTSVPVIAVPTSVGYGANLGGLTTLFAMLSSCASGLTVVNIDNGFGAAIAATRINCVGLEDQP